MSQDTVLICDTVKASLRSDKHKNPVMREYRHMTYGEVKTALPSHILILDLNNRVVTVKVTSVKTWKTRPTIRIGCKWGMYEYFTMDIEPGTDSGILMEVKE